jgi:hypothetical protein
MVCAKDFGAPLRITEMLLCLGLETDAGAVHQHIRLYGAVAAVFDVMSRVHIPLLHGDAAYSSHRLSCEFSRL